MKDKTMLIHLSEQENKYDGAVVPPIFQNSLFTFDDWDAIDFAFQNPEEAFIYSRGNNPGVTLVEEKLAALAQGESAKMFASGMGAISSAIMHCVNYGDHIITIKNVYGPTNQFISEYLKNKSNITSTFVEGKDIKEFEEAIQPNTKLIYLESPSSVVLSLQDLEKVAELAKKHGIKTIIDNTWATPIFQKPLTMGIDLEVHSCSKYLGGHSDLVSGIVIGSKEDVDQIKVTESALFGAKMAPFEAWLVLRSLRTLPIRMREHMKSAAKIVSFLDSHDQINEIHYPGHESFDQYELGKKQMNGYSALFSFSLKTTKLEDVKTFVNSLKLFKIGVSWGGHESLVYAPAISLSKELSEEQFEMMNLSVGDIRVSIGLEDVDDLINDLEEALNKISN